MKGTIKNLALKLLDQVNLFHMLRKSMDDAVASRPTDDDHEAPEPQGTSTTVVPIPHLTISPPHLPNSTRYQDTDDPSNPGTAGASDLVSVPSVEETPLDDMSDALTVSSTTGTSSPSRDVSPLPGQRGYFSEDATPSGATFFSVPPSTVPPSGVYMLPVEAFQFRDLDSGKTFYMDKRYWIKDVDTGKVYVVEPPEEGLANGQQGSGETSASGDASGGTPHPRGSQSVRVSDLLSGTELSLEEFERALGYSREAADGPGAGQQRRDNSHHGSPSASSIGAGQATHGIQSLSLGESTCRERII